MIMYSTTTFSCKTKRKKNCVTNQTIEHEYLMNTAYAFENEHLHLTAKNKSDDNEGHVFLIKQTKLRTYDKYRFPILLYSLCVSIIFCDIFPGS